MKKLLIVICAAMLICFTGCQPKDKKLSTDEVSQLMDLLSSNNPYREKDSIVQLNFNKANMSMDMNEMATATLQEPHTLIIKDIYHTDDDNVYKLEIMLGNDIYELFLTIVKEDATELIIELPVSGYKETYILDRGYNTADLFAYLSEGYGFMDPGPTITAKFEKLDDGSYRFSAYDSSNGNLQYMANVESKYIGINIYELTGDMHLGNGEVHSNEKMYVKLLKDTNIIDLDVLNDYFPMGGNYYRMTY